MPKSVFREILKDAWPHPRRWGDGVLYNFNSDYCLIGLTWYGPKGGYVCDIQEWDDPQTDVPCRPASVETWIGDSWGAMSLEEACLSCERAMRSLLAAEGKDPEDF